jgi:hypothetical protein
MRASSFHRILEMRPILAVLLLACLSGTVSARELADAPEVTLLGFSPDGRYFAYEQHEDDSVSDTAVAAIDVIDRRTNGSAKGFPYGFLGVSRSGEFPLRVGGHKIKISETLEGTARLDALRAAVRNGTKRPLAALKIGQHPGRRLAGRPISDRTPGGGAPEFVLGPTLPGPVPDLQHVYRVATEIAPNDTEACIGESKPQDHRIVVRIDAFAGDDADREKPVAGTPVEVPWPAGDSDCASAVRVTDVIAAPNGAAPSGAAPSGATTHVVVVMLAISWSGHAESSRYFAAFVPLPQL